MYQRETVPSVLAWKCVVKVLLTLCSISFLSFSITMLLYEYVKRRSERLTSSLGFFSSSNTVTG